MKETNMPDNPVEGPGLSNNDAESAISGFLGPLRGEPGPEAAPPADNPDKPRDDKGRFARPEVEEPDADDGADRQIDPDADEAGQVADDDTPADDGERPDPDPEDGGEGVDLPDTFDGLAEALEVDGASLADFLQVNVKVGGEDKQVPLSEAVQGYQRLEDYRKKTADLSKQRTEFQQERERVQGQERQIADRLIPLVQHLHATVQDEQKRVEAMLDPGSEHYNPEGYYRAKQDFDKKVQLVQQAAQAEQQRQAREQHEQAQRQREDIVKNEQRLLEKFPEWAKSPEKGKQAVTDLRHFAMEEYGIPEDVASQFYEAAYFEILHDAMQYRRLQKAKPAVLKKAKEAPGKTLKPGAKRAPRDRTADQLRGNLNRLKRSGGKDKDAAAGAISAFLHKRRGK